MGPLPEEETLDGVVAPETYPRGTARYHHQHLPLCMCVWACAHTGDELVLEVKKTRS
jgi:hypothetical protein